MCPSNTEIHTLSIECDNKMSDADAISGFQEGDVTETWISGGNPCTWALPRISMKLDHLCGRAEA